MVVGRMCGNKKRVHFIPDLF